MKEFELKEIETEDDDKSTYSYGPCKVHVRRDESGDGGPREWDNLWEWYSNHRRYSFDSKDGKRLEIGDIYDDSDRQEGETICEAILRQNPDLLDARPINMYDHSGITVSLGSFADPWDSGVGAIAVVTREQAKKNFPDAKDDEELKSRAYECLKGEVESYDQYLRGDVYGYVCENADGKETDSCWGFYETPEEVAKEGSAMFSMKDLTTRTLGSVDLVNELNARGAHISRTAWIDEIKDGESRYVVGVTVYDPEIGPTYSAPEIAEMLGYERGEFDGHSVKVWCEENMPLDSKGANS